MRESTHSFSKPLLSGRGLRFLVAAGLVAGLGTIAYSQATPSHLEAAAKAAAVAASTTVVSNGSDAHINSSFDATMDKVASIVSSAPPHARATAVLVGGGLVTLAPMVVATLPPVIVYSATKVLFPDVVKFISS